MPSNFRIHRLIKAGGYPRSYNPLYAKTVSWVLNYLSLLDGFKTSSSHTLDLQMTDVPVLVLVSVVAPI